MLLAMAVHDTDENSRTWMTESTLIHLGRTVDWNRHRFFVIDNNSCQKTQDLYGKVRPCGFPNAPFTLIQNESNEGTAKAINKAWRHREPGEHALKIDNDCLIYQAGWADMIEDVFRRDPEIGICALKRKDLVESPWAEGTMKSTLRMLPHERGEQWLIVEEVNGVIGTCEAFSSALLDKIGYLTQPGLYGYDDALASLRAKIAGYKRVFLHGIEISHIDPGGDAYCQWKIDSASRDFPEFSAMAALYEAGVEDIYYDGS